MYVAPENIWDQLDLEPTHDVRAIKRAYATRLKHIRPDEDAPAFQALREARDEALWAAQFEFNYDEDDQVSCAEAASDCEEECDVDEEGEGVDEIDLDLNCLIGGPIEESDGSVPDEGFVCSDIQTRLALHLSAETIWDLSCWQQVIAEFEPIYFLKLFVICLTKSS